MPFDIEDITGTDPGRGQKTSPGFDPSDVRAAAQSGTGQTKQNLIAGTIDPTTNFNDFRFQPKTNADNYLLRAQDQGFWESLGKTIGNTVANIPLDVVQGVGYLGTLLEFGDDRDYNNTLTSEMEKLKNPLGEVYLEHPNQTFDLGDSAWWLNNLGQLAESSASFAVEGLGIAKVFGTLAKTAAWSTRAAKLGELAAQGLSASTLTYMEGAMSGAQVYETAYNNNYTKLYQQGVNPSDADEQAKHIASQAAAATVQLHTALNLALNLTGLTPLFREPDQAIVSWWRKNGQPLAGETGEQWATRIAEAVPDGMPLKKLLGMNATGPLRLGVEALQEGLEEVNTQYAEHIGKAIGERKEDKDVTGRFADLDRYFSEVLNQEGALNLALGALGGLAQTTLLDHIPVHKVIKYGPDGQPLMTEQGEPQVERVSSHTRDERMNRQYFDNIKDALGKDMQWFTQKNQELEQAFKDKDLATIARVKADLLSVHNLRAISMGLGNVWKQQYQDIAALDNVTSLGKGLQPQLDALTQQMQDAFNSGNPDIANQLNAQRLQIQEQQNQLRDVTEAMQKGYAQNKTDNDYKAKALQAIQSLDYLTKLYEDTQDRYTGTPEMEQSGLAEHMFYRQANLYLQKQQIDNLHQDLVKLKVQVDEMNLSQQDDILVNQAKDYLSDKEVWQTTVKKLNQDIARLNEAVKSNNSAVFLKLLDKYKIPATKDAARKLTDLLERRKAELESRATESNKALSDTVELWQQNNPGKAIDDIMNKATQRPLLEDLYQQNKTYHQQVTTEYETAREQFSTDSTEKGIRNYLAQNKPEDIKKQQKKEHIEAYNQQMDREIAASMDAKQKQDHLTALTGEITRLDNTIGEARGRIMEHEKNLANSPGFKNILSRMTIRENIADEQANIKQLEFQRNALVNRRNALLSQVQQATEQSQNVSRTPPPVAQPVTNTTPASTPAQNTTQEFNDELPDFDFSQEVIPSFTTIQQGDPVFDQIMGGNEQGNTIRQFVQLRKDTQLEVLVSGVRTMLQKTNQQMPSEDDFNKFITPYIAALKAQYQSQKPSVTQDYENLRSILKPAALSVLDILEGEFREHGFSYDRAQQVLNDQVKQGNLSKQMIGTIMTRMKDYLEQVPDPVIEQQTPVESPNEPVEQESIEDQPTTYIPPTPDSEPTIFTNASLDLVQVKEQNKLFVGAQNIEGVKANFNTNPYREFEIGNIIRTIADYTELDPKVNTDVLIPGRIIPGDDVIFVVDEQWSGKINYDTEMMQNEYGEQLRRADMFQNYLESPDRIGMSSSAQHPMGAHANVPIKILHQSSGKTIGYLPRAGWILKKYPDTDNYANIADEYRDGDIVVTGNVVRQYNRIMKLREAIVRAWNTNKNLRLTSKISKRGTGHVMLNREVNKNTGTTKLVNRSAKNMLPDSSLEIAIIKQGTAYVGSGIASQKQIATNLPGYMASATSMPVALLPSPDGTYMPTPLYTHRLGDNPGQLNTLVGAIKLYLRSTTGQLRAGDEKTIARIREATGFDLQSPESLRNFVQQYFTYTQKFGEKDTVIMPSEAKGNANSQFMLDIPDLAPGEKVAFIKVGTSFSGEKPIYAQLIDGELHPDFEQALREGLAGRFKNVVFAGKELRGINSQGEFKAPLIKKDGTVQINTYQNYNEYVKANSTTFVYGLNKVGNQYVYMANPVVQLDYEKALQSAPPVISTSLPETTTQTPSVEDQQLEEPDELADLFGNGILSPSPGSVAPLSIPSEGNQVSLEFLQELRNLTPEAHRNSKTPEQVLRELFERGVTVLAEGHNPFYTC